MWTRWWLRATKDSKMVDWEHVQLSRWHLISSAVLFKWFLSNNTLLRRRHDRDNWRQLSRNKILSIIQTAKSSPSSKLVKCGYNNILVIKSPMKLQLHCLFIFVAAPSTCEKKVTANQKCLDKASRWLSDWILKTKTSWIDCGQSWETLPDKIYLTRHFRRPQ